MFFLANILENFRDVCMTCPGLSLLYSDMLPNFAFALYQTLLMITIAQSTCVEIDSVYDNNMNQMIVKQITRRNTTDNLFRT